MKRAVPYVFVLAAIVACGSTSHTSGSPGGSDASPDAARDSGAATLPDASSDSAPVGAPSDPGKLVCGAEVCNVPGQLCCFSSVAPGGAPDHCVSDRGACNAPYSACDEGPDCSSGLLCCTSTAVLPRDASVGGVEVTSCVDPTAQSSCLPRPGVGTSSVQACKTDAECRNGKPCVAQYCFGRVLQTCGPDAQCL